MSFAFLSRINVLFQVQGDNAAENKPIPSTPATTPLSSPSATEASEAASNSEEIKPTEEGKGESTSVIAPAIPTTTTSTPTPAPTSMPTATANPQDHAQIIPLGNSELPTGETNEQAITELMAMGFERDQVIYALRANEDDQEQALEYLLNVSARYWVG